MKKISIFFLIILSLLVFTFRSIFGLFIDHYLGKLFDPEILESIKFEDCTWKFEYDKSYILDQDKDTLISEINENHGKYTALQSVLFLGTSLQQHSLVFYNNFALIFFPSGSNEVIHLKNFNEKELQNSYTTHKATIFIDPYEPWKKLYSKYEIKISDEVLYLVSKTKVGDAEVKLVQLYSKINK